MRPLDVRRACLEPLQGLARERHVPEQSGPLVAHPVHATEGQATWMAEEHQLKHAERMPASNIVAVPSCEARPPQRRRSRIKRCATPALPVKYAGSLVESARQTS